MPRHNRRVEPDVRSARPVAAQREELFDGQPFVVRTLTASARLYRCPGCDQEIVRVPHVVTWPADELDAANRRHWHAACWAARESRRPIVRGFTRRTGR